MIKSLTGAVSGVAVFAWAVAVAQDQTITIVVDGGIDSPGAYYKIAGSEGIEKIDGEVDGHIVTVNDDDVLAGNIVRGYIRSGKDGYRILGEIVALEIENPDAATIYVNGEVYDLSADDTTEDAAQVAAATNQESEEAARDDPGAVMHPDPFEPGEKAIIDCIVAKRRNPDAKTPCDKDEDDDSSSSAATTPAAKAPALPSRPGAIGEVTIRPGASVKRPTINPKAIGETEKNDDIGEKEAATPVVIKPVVKPVDVILPTLDDDTADRKGDKGNETTETTPVIGFAGGEPTLSSTSGRRGEQTYSFDFLERALNDIGWREKFDKACQVNMLSQLEGDKLWARILQHCGNDDTFACERETCKADMIGLDETHDVQITGQRTAITALRVCVNGRNNGRVKGIEVRGGEILDNASMSIHVETAADTLPHCREWKPLVLCPAGMAATGLRAHFDAGSGLSSEVSQLVGVQLVCRKIVKK